MAYFPVIGAVLSYMRKYNASFGLFFIALIDSFKWNLILARGIAAGAFMDSILFLSPSEDFSKKSIASSLSALSILPVSRYVSGHPWNILYAWKKFISSLPTLATYRRKSHLLEKS